MTVMITMKLSHNHIRQRRMLLPHHHHPIATFFGRQLCILIVRRPMLPLRLPQLRIVMRRLLIDRHQPDALPILSAGHIQMRKLVHTAERTRHIALHRRTQRHRSAAIVAPDVGVRHVARLIDGDVNGGGGGAVMRMRGQMVGAHVAVALRREARRLVAIDVGRQRQALGERIAAHGAAMEAGFCRVASKVKRGQE